MDRSATAWWATTVVCSFGVGVVAGTLIRRWSHIFRSRSAVVGPCKMVLVVRNDIRMTKGKIAAQCCHAAVACFRKASEQAPELLDAWRNSGSPKICLKVENKEILLELHGKAETVGVISAYIRDAGHTQVSPGTITVLGIGPAEDNDVDEITGNLKLL